MATFPWNGWQISLEYAHLSGFAEKARKRGDKGDFWWELRACGYYGKFAKTKIFYPDITDYAKFHLDKTGSLSGNTGYFYPSDSVFLLGLLNSTATWFFLKGMTDSIRGGYLRMFTQNLDLIPIPTTNETDKQVIADSAEQCQTEAEKRYQLEQQVQRRWLENLRPHGNSEPLNTKLSQWWTLSSVTELAAEARKAFKLKKADELKADLSKLDVQDEWESYLNKKTQEWQAITQAIKSLEQKINAAVYVLFKLTPDEIKLIESSLKTQQ